MLQTLTHQDKPLSGPQTPVANKTGFFGTIVMFLRHRCADWTTPAAVLP
jgi:hypothetical protein